MELGNQIFGNSRGEYSLDREFQDYFVTFLDWNGFNCYGNGDNKLWSESKKAYVHNQYEIRPYYWGDCECNYEEKEDKWCSENDHRDYCYQTELQESGYWELDYKDPQKQLIIDKLLKEFNLPEEGCCVHCTCDYELRWAEFASKNEHKNCRISMPNFKNNNNGFEIQWYKYPLRDAYSNMEVNDYKHFTELVEE